MARYSCGFLPIIILTLRVIRSLYTVQGFECHVGIETASWTDDNTHSVNITWNCTLMYNESVISILWSKGDKCIAKTIQGVFTPCPTYVGRVEMFGTFGISVHNISRTDTGYYNIVILSQGNIQECLRCPSIYLLVLMEQHNKENAEPMDGSLSKLNIGLICGLILVTIIVLAQGLRCVYRRSGPAKNRHETTNPDQIQMLQGPLPKE
ncbi:hypothetical protein ACJMK2_024422 [Sinanodonta woodiana]|uniref:Uncharacterized protein n=1 Tax=Sinanodonta woodiana TaxID=1069815 RepID=A0ABD3XGY0_SINWO